MKIKLLLAPGLIVVTIALLIWVVYPAWSNGTNGVKERLETLRLEKEKLSNLEGKDRNVGSLYEEIKNNPDKYDIVKKFVPENMNEEGIIDNLNYLASTQQTYVTKLVVNQPFASFSAQAMDPALGGESSSGALKNVPKDFQVNYSVIGNYGNIKALFDKVHRLDQFNRVISLTIANAKTPEGKNDGENLVADAVLQFDFLKKAKINNVDDPIFSQSKFDFSSIAKLQEAKNIGSLKLELGEVGKSNPYMP